MWVFTIDGFYSAVQHRDQADSLTVRTRDREDMVRMQQRVGNDAPISHTPHRDYAYRITLSKAGWAAYSPPPVRPSTTATSRTRWLSDRDRTDPICTEKCVTMLELQREGA